MTMPGGGGDRADWMRSQLWNRRVVLLSGDLDDAAATQASTELMALAAAGDEGVTLQVDCRGGTLQAGLMIIDVIDLLGVPVHARVAGRAEGVSAGIVAVADIRSADANNAGLYSELDAILAVSIGGTALAGGRFMLLGSIIGALLIQTLTTTILTRGVPPAATYVLKALLIVVVCLLQSEAFRAALRRWFKRTAGRAA